MKKVLIASTALILVAGAAAAEVKVSGKARMGVVYDGTDAAFSSRVRIIFDGSGETDGGLAFGASVRNDQSGVGNTKNGDSTVFVSGSFGKITMGDTGNAADAIVGQVSGAGYGPYDALQEIDWLGKDVTGAYYEYSAGAITAGLGFGQVIDTDADPTNDDLISAAVKYSAGNYGVALGYEDNASNSQISLSGSAAFGAATVKAKAVSRDTVLAGTDSMAYAVSVDYTMGATTLTAFAARNIHFDDPKTGTNDDTMGLGAAYDLGGGAAIKGAIQDDGTNTVADLGVTFSF